MRLFLEKIGSSRPFANAHRSNRFLRFIVEERLAGRLDRIQEYVLGLDVLDRKENFDPRIDSIVRVEGRRLRLRLQEYYRTDGRTDSIRIELPKRGYVPEFRFAPAPKPQLRISLLIGVTVLFVAALVAIVARIGARSGTDSEFKRGPIAVLPFTNLSGDPEQEPLASGVTDALITELARLPALHVISRTSIVPYQGSKKSAPVIARELGTRLLLEGAVFRSGNRIRLTAQLIDAENDSHIWAQSYEREITDIFQVQSDLVRRVAREVHIQVSPELDHSLSTAPVVNEKALDAYLKGRFAQNQWTGEAALRAAAFFEEAILEEPRFALAHAWLAAAYRTAATMGDSSPTELLPRALVEARKAVELAPYSSETHSSLAVSLAMDWNWAEAEQHFAKALQLSPQDAEAHHRFAILYLAPLGRLQEADAEIRAAVQLDGASLNHRVILGKIVYFQGRTTEALAELSEVLKKDPNYADGLRNLGATYVRMHRFEEADAAYRKAQSLTPTNWGAGLLAHALAQSGKQQEARHMLRTLLDRSKHTPGMALAIGTVFAGLGEQDQALRWLESARAEKEVRLMLVNVDPMYEPLRPTARFRRLCAALGLDPPAGGRESHVSRQAPESKAR
ncbi:MAG TPA: tetratricopeptide repeat protein [Paludibaculum sp.]